MTQPRALTWDWDAEAQAAGASRDGRFNAATMELAPERALIWRRTDGSTVTYSAAELQTLVGELAAGLVTLGVRQGDRVAGLVGRRPAAFIAALASWRIGAIYVPLFTGFGGEGLRVRLLDSTPKAIVTDTPSRPALDAVAADLPGLEVLLVDAPTTDGALGLQDVRARELPVPPLAETQLHDTATIIYTSGTTGLPKGCEMPHRAVISLRPFVRHCLAVAAGDVLFSGADAGWSFGLLTTGLAPMALGVRRAIYEGPFDATGWWQAIAELDAHHAASAPTGFRQLARAGAAEIPPTFRAATSAGEPLDVATVEWFVEHAGVLIHDSYGLSELGMITANLRDPWAPPVAAGSMGVAVPGFDVALLDSDGNPVQGEGTGRIAVRDNGFFMSAGYWDRQDEWDARLVDGRFLTEDIARRDELGRYWYVARNDEIIVTAGYNVSPAEVEAVLLAHPLIVDAAAVGETDALKGHVVAAHVVLAAPEPEDLLGELRQWIGTQVGWHAAPRRCHIHSELPRTASGKLRRGALTPPADGARG
ncbi:MAG: acetyl-CoA synthetase [Solirubrobacteraceae bacterium]